MIEPTAFTVQYTNVRQYAGRLRSNVHRSAERSIRAGKWREYHGGRRPRGEDEIMVAWLARRIRREGNFPINLDQAKWTYDPGTSGPIAIQTVSLDVLVPENDVQRDIFRKITRFNGRVLAFPGTER